MQILEQFLGFENEHKFSGKLSFTLFALKSNFKLTHVVGSVYKNGNVEFFPNGTDIICPIGNKLNIFNLKE